MSEVSCSWWLGQKCASSYLYNNQNWKLSSIFSSIQLFFQSSVWALNANNFLIFLSNPYCDYMNTQPWMWTIILHLLNDYGNYDLTITTSKNNISKLLLLSFCSCHLKLLWMVNARNYARSVIRIDSACFWITSKSMTSSPVPWNFSIQIEPHHPCCLVPWTSMDTHFRVIQK